jgi:hypothetical protein
MIYYLYNLLILGDDNMQKERLTVVLKPELRRRIKIKAAERDLTVSEVVQEYLESMLEKEEIEEDIALSKFAEEREKTFTKTESLTHDEVWG